MNSDQALHRPCPFCGGAPRFEGDAADWHDDCRYVELRLTCCVTMTEAMGWVKARALTPQARDAELRAALTARWNEREGEDAKELARLRVLLEINGLQHSHACRRCGVRYTPEGNEDCPACGFDGGDASLINSEQQP